MKVNSAIFSSIIGSLAGVTFKRRYSQIIGSSKIGPKVNPLSIKQTQNKDEFARYRRYINPLGILLNNSFYDYKKRITSGNKFDEINYKYFDPLVNQFRILDAHKISYSNRTQLLIKFKTLLLSGYGIWTIEFDKIKGPILAESQYYYFVILFSPANRYLGFADAYGSSITDNKVNFTFPVLEYNDYIFVNLVLLSKDNSKCSNSIYCGKILVEV